MTETDLLDYLAAFNSRDYDRMLTYYHPDVVLELPSNTLFGPGAIKAFYQDLHSAVRELLAIDFLMFGEGKIALELYTEFRAFRDRPRFTFGALAAGEIHRCTNMVHYDLRDDLFARIRVGSYRTWAPGERLEDKDFPGVPDVEGAHHDPA